MKSGKITIGEAINVELPFGLRLDVTIEKIQEDKPLIYEYTYSMNNLKFREWLESMKYLTEGPLAFTAKGIQVMIVNGLEKWDKTAFTIDTDEIGEKLCLDLLNEDVVFHVHRDLFAGKEWEILIDNCPRESQDLTNTAGAVEENDVPF